MRSVLHVLTVVFVLSAGSLAGDESAWTLFDKGLKEFNKGRFDSAERIFEAAARMDARCEDAFYYLGRIKERKGKTQEALANYKRVSDKVPTYSLAAERLGHLALRTGDKEAAVKYFAIYAEARPSANAWMQLASVQLDMRKFEDAEAALKKASEVSSGNLDLTDMYGRLYMETSRFPEALDAYTQIVKKIPMDNTARYLRGVCLQRLEREDEAVQEWETILKRDPYHGLALKALLAVYGSDPSMADRVRDFKVRLQRLAKSKQPARPVKGEK